MATDTALPDPGIVLDLLQAFRCSKAMFAAVSLGAEVVLSPDHFDQLRRRFVCQRTPRASR